MSLNPWFFSHCSPIFHWNGPAAATLRPRNPEDLGSHHRAEVHCQGLTGQVTWDSWRFMEVNGDQWRLMKVN
jgi:hypothetical protein